MKIITKKMNNFQIYFSVVTLILIILFLNIFITDWYSFKNKIISLEIQSSVNGTAQLFYDIGSGINEKDSKKHIITKKNDFSTVKFHIPSKEIFFLRLDPIDKVSSNISIKNIRLERSNGEFIKSIPLNILSSHQGIKEFSINDNILSLIGEHDSHDPIIHINNTNFLYEKNQFYNFSLKKLPILFLYFFVILTVLYYGLRAISASEMIKSFSKLWPLLLVKSIKSLVYIAIMSVLLLEVIGYLIFDNRYNWDLRYLYYSKTPIVNEYSTSKTFWKYKPNSNIRTIAVYQGLFKPSIEYDCTFSTNEFGFINTGEITKSIDLLVLGDSYVEGQGGCPWLTEDTILGDDKLSKLKILNGGLMGAGILHFEQVLNYMNSNIDIENIIIIAISNDFTRYDPVEWNTESECYLTGLCNEPNDHWYYIPFETTDSEIISTSIERNNTRDITFMNRILKVSFSYRLYSEYKTIFNNMYTSHSSSEKENNLTRYNANLDALKRIKLLFPDLKIILVPQRDEVGIIGRKNLDSLIVERYLDKNNYQFSWCTLTESDYMPVDAHPNRQGYKKLFNCLKKNTFD